MKTVSKIVIQKSIPLFAALLIVFTAFIVIPSAGVTIKSIAAIQAYPEIIRNIDNGEYQADIDNALEGELKTGAPDLYRLLKEKNVPVIVSRVWDSNYGAHGMAVYVPLRGSIIYLSEEYLSKEKDNPLEDAAEQGDRTDKAWNSFLSSRGLTPQMYYALDEEERMVIGDEFHAYYDKREAEQYEASKYKIYLGNLAGLMKHELRHIQRLHYGLDPAGIIGDFQYKFNRVQEERASINAESGYKDSWFKYISPDLWKAISLVSAAAVLLGTGAYLAVRTILKKGRGAAGSAVSSIAAVILLPFALAAIIVLSPIAAITSGRSPFVSDMRVGYRAKPIRVWKLRTWVKDQEGVLRKTAFGRIARLRALDEIPQIFSIIKGDMQWFGPRPNLPEDVNQWYLDNILSRTKPGLFNYRSLKMHSRASEEEDSHSSVYDEVRSLNERSFVNDAKLLLRLIVFAFFVGAIKSIRFKMQPKGRPTVAGKRSAAVIGSGSAQNARPRRGWWVSKITRAAGAFLKKAFIIPFITALIVVFIVFYAAPSVYTAVKNIPVIRDYSQTIQQVNNNGEYAQDIENALEWVVKAKQPGLYKMIREKEIPIIVAKINDAHPGARGLHMYVPFRGSVIYISEEFLSSEKLNPTVDAYEMTKRVDTQWSSFLNSWGLTQQAFYALDGQTREDISEKWSSYSEEHKIVESQEELYKRYLDNASVWIIHEAEHDRRLTHGFDPSGFIGELQYKFNRTHEEWAANNAASGYKMSSIRYISGGLWKFLFVISAAMSAVGSAVYFSTRRMVIKRRKNTVLENHEYQQATAEKPHPEEANAPKTKTYIKVYKADGQLNRLRRGDIVVLGRDKGQPQKTQFRIIETPVLIGRMNPIAKAADISTGTAYALKFSTRKFSVNYEAEIISNLPEHESLPNGGIWSDRGGRGGIVVVTGWVENGKSAFPHSYSIDDYAKENYGKRDDSKALKELIGMLSGVAGALAAMEKSGYYFTADLKAKHVLLSDANTVNLRDFASVKKADDKKYTREYLIDATFKQLLALIDGLCSERFEGNRKYEGIRNYLFDKTDQNRSIRGFAEFLVKTNKSGLFGNITEKEITFAFKAIDQHQINIRPVEAFSGFETQAEGVGVKFYRMVFAAKAPPAGLEKLSDEPCAFARMKGRILEIYLSGSAMNLNEKKFKPEEFRGLAQIIAAHEYAETVKGYSHQNAINAQRIKGLKAIADKLEKIQQGTTVRLSPHEARALSLESVGEVNMEKIPDALFDWRLEAFGELGKKEAFMRKSAFMHTFGQTLSGYTVVTVINNTNARKLHVYWPAGAFSPGQAFIIEGDRQLFLPEKPVKGFVKGSLVALSRLHPGAKELRKFLTMWVNEKTDAGKQGMYLTVDPSLQGIVEISGSLEVFAGQAPRTDLAGFLVSNRILDRKAEALFVNGNGIRLDGIRLPVIRKNGQTALCELTVAAFLLWLIKNGVNWTDPDFNCLLNRRMSEMKNLALRQEIGVLNEVFSGLLASIGSLDIRKNAWATLLRLELLEAQIMHLKELVEGWEKSGAKLAVEKSHIKEEDGRMRVAGRRLKIPSVIADQIMSFKISATNRKGLVIASVILRNDPADIIDLPRIMTIAGDTSLRLFINGKPEEKEDLIDIADEDVRSFVRVTEETGYDLTGAKKVGEAIIQVVPKSQAGQFKDKLHLQVSGIVQSRGFSSRHARILYVLDDKYKLAGRAIIDPDQEGFHIIRINGAVFRLEKGRALRLFDYCPALLDKLRTEERLEFSLNDGVVSANSQFFKIIPEALINKVKERVEITFIRKADQPYRLLIEDKVDRNLLAQIEFRGYDALLLEEEKEITLRRGAKRQQVMVFMHSAKLLSWLKQFSPVQADQPLDKGYLEMSGHRIHLFPEVTTGKRKGMFSGQSREPEIQEKFRRYLSKKVSSVSRRFGHAQAAVERRLMIDAKLLARLSLLCEGHMRIEIYDPFKAGKYPAVLKLDLSAQPYNINLISLSQTYMENIEALWQEFLKEECLRQLWASFKISVDELERLRREGLITSYYLAGSLARGDFRVKPHDVDFAVEMTPSSWYQGRELLRGTLAQEGDLTFMISSFAPYGNMLKVTDSGIRREGVLRPEIVKQVRDGKPCVIIKLNSVYDRIYANPEFLVELYGKIRKYRDEATSGLFNNLTKRKIARFFKDIDSGRIGLKAAEGFSGFDTKIEGKQVKFYEMVFAGKAPPCAFARQKDNLLEIYFSSAALELLEKEFKPEEFPGLANIMTIHEYAEIIGFSHRDAIELQRIKGLEEISGKLEAIQGKSRLFTSARKTLPSSGRYRSIEGRGLRGGNISSEENAYIDWLENGLSKSKIKAEYISRIANSLVRMRQDTLSERVKQGVLSEEEKENIIALRKFDTRALAARLSGLILAYPAEMTQPNRSGLLKQLLPYSEIDRLKSVYSIETWLAMYAAVHTPVDSESFIRKALATARRLAEEYPVENWVAMRAAVNSPVDPDAFIRKALAAAKRLQETYGVEKGLAMIASVINTKDPDAFIRKALAAAKRLQDEYKIEREQAMHIAFNHPTDPEAFARKALAAAERLRNVYGLDKWMSMRIAVYYPTDPDGFIKNAIAVSLRLQSEFQVEKSLALEIAVHNPTDPGSFMEKALAAAKRIQDNYGITRWLAKRIAVHHPINPEDFAQNALKVAAQLQDKYGIEKGWALHAAVRNPTDPDAFVAGIIKKRKNAYERILVGLVPQAPSKVRYELKDGSIREISDAKHEYRISLSKEETSRVSQVTVEIEQAKLVRNVISRIRLGVFKGSPLTRIAGILKFLEVKPGEKFLDLGSGDGRVVFLANALCGANSTGVEIDERLLNKAELARGRLIEKGIVNPERIKFVKGDFLQEDWSAYNLLFYYSFGTFKTDSIVEKAIREIRPGAKLVVLALKRVSWMNHFDDFTRLMDANRFTFHSEPGLGVWVFTRKGPANDWWQDSGLYGPCYRIAGAEKIEVHFWPRPYQLKRDIIKLHSAYPQIRSVTREDLAPLAQAMRLVRDVWPGKHDEILDYTRKINIRPEPKLPLALGFTVPGINGLMLLNSYFTDVPSLTETIIHENQHSYFIREYYSQKLENSSEHLNRAWGKQLTVQGLLSETVAYLEMVKFRMLYWRGMIKNDPDTAFRKTYQKQTGDLLKEIGSVCDLIAYKLFACPSVLGKNQVDLFLRAREELSAIEKEAGAPFEATSGLFNNLTKRKIARFFKDIDSGRIGLKAAEGFSGFDTKIEGKQVKFYEMVFAGKAPPCAFARQKDNLLEIYFSSAALELLEKEFKPEEFPGLSQVIALHEYAETVKGLSHQEAVLCQRVAGLEATADKLEAIQCRFYTTTISKFISQAFPKGTILAPSFANPTDTRTAEGNRNACLDIHKTGEGFIVDIPEAEEGSKGKIIYPYYAVVPVIIAAKDIPASLKEAIGATKAKEKEVTEKTGEYLKEAASKAMLPVMAKQARSHKLTDKGMRALDAESVIAIINPVTGDLLAQVTFWAKDKEEILAAGRIAAKESMLTDLPEEWYRQADIADSVSALGFLSLNAIRFFEELRQSNKEAKDLLIRVISAIQPGELLKLDGIEYDRTMGVFRSAKDKPEELYMGKNLESFLAQLNTVQQLASLVYFLAVPSYDPVTRRAKGLTRYADLEEAVIRFYYRLYRKLDESAIRNFKDIRVFEPLRKEIGIFAGRLNRAVRRKNALEFNAQDAGSIVSGLKGKAALSEEEISDLSAGHRLYDILQLAEMLSEDNFVRAFYSCKVEAPKRVLPEEKPYEAYDGTGRIARLAMALRLVSDLNNPALSPDYKSRFLVRSRSIAGATMEEKFANCRESLEEMLADSVIASSKLTVKTAQKDVELSELIADRRVTFVAGARALKAKLDSLTDMEIESVYPVKVLLDGREIALAYFLDCDKGFRARAKEERVNVYNIPRPNIVIDNGVAYHFSLMIDATPGGVEVVGWKEEEVKALSKEELDKKKIKELSGPTVFEMVGTEKIDDPEYKLEPVSELRVLRQLSRQIEEKRLEPGERLTYIKAQIGKLTLPLGGGVHFFGRFLHKLPLIKENGFNYMTPTSCSTNGASYFSLALSTITGLGLKNLSLLGLTYHMYTSGSDAKQVYGHLSPKSTGAAKGVTQHLKLAAALFTAVRTPTAFKDGQTDVVGGSIFDFILQLPYPVKKQTLIAYLERVGMEFPEMLKVFEGRPDYKWQNTITGQRTGSIFYEGLFSQVNANTFRAFVGYDNEMSYSFKMDEMKEAYYELLKRQRDRMERYYALPLNGEKIDNYIRKEPCEEEGTGGSSVVYRCSIDSIKGNKLFNTIRMAKKVRTEGENTFYRNVILSLLDEYFLKKGNYSVSHIPAPLGWIKNACFYIFVQGEEGFPWDLGPFGHVQIEEWNSCIGSFGAAGVSLSSDVTTPDDGRVSKNIIVEPYKISELYETMKLSKIWKRIDVDSGSVGIREEELERYIRENRDSLQNILGWKFSLLETVFEIYFKGKNAQKEGNFTQLFGKYQKEILREYLYPYSKQGITDKMTESRNKKIRPVILIILDGFGYNRESRDNAVVLAKKPVIDKLMNECPSTLINTSGLAVGLPEGEMGNSEVGHLNIGAGRVIRQDVVRINDSIKEGAFFSNAALKEAVVHLKNNPGSKLHLMGLISNAVVHSSIGHLHALLQFAKQEGLKDVYVHAITDGRDSPPQSGKVWIQALLEEIRKIGAGRIATVCGRYYAMDRDNRWERVNLAYDLYTQGTGIEAQDAIAALEGSYLNEPRGDEFVKPVVMVNPEQKPLALIKDGDVVIFFNFRADRAREIARAFMDKEFKGFERKTHPKIKWLCMTEHDKSFYDFAGLSVIFSPEPRSNTLGEVISKNGLRQLHIAETEKYAHVTFFLNGGIERPFENEERILIPSPKVATYDLKPEMSAREVTEALTKRIREGTDDFIVVNYANPDMVGHTGILEAAIKAVEAADACLGETLEAVNLQKGVALVIADHGNAEEMSGQYKTSHTLNPVLCILVDPHKHLGKVSLREGGALCDIAPTLLEILHIEQPREMTGKSLFDKKGHAFCPKDGFIASAISLGAGLTIALGLTFLLGSVSAIIIAGLFAGYGIWTSVKFALLGRATFNIAANMNPHLPARTVLSYPVARSDGTITSEFEALRKENPKAAKEILTHESSKSHFLGMLKLLPGKFILLSIGIAALILILGQKIEWGSGTVGLAMVFGGMFGGGFPKAKIRLFFKIAIGKAEGDKEFAAQILEEIANKGMAVGFAASKDERILAFELWKRFLEIQTLKDYAKDISEEEAETRILEIIRKRYAEESQVILDNEALAKLLLGLMSQNEELSLEIDRILTNELNLGLELREMIRAA
ncbi:MAG: 2,3-bisphosphoglycerate-independent phosphoglycerate mutase, partial [Candidatus Omnitrophica bacterium]|nr:2,3-bisphosphoglycerate-independent phosphoglycerate mutase [Candidatus Omnitrophota bacterium]